MDGLTAAVARDLDAAFPLVVDRYGSLLFGLALRICGDPRDAEEVAQDAFVRAYRALRTYDDERRRSLHLRPWLAAIALNLARNRSRRRAADRASEPLSETHHERPARDDTAGEVQRRDELDRWRRLIDALPLHLRVPLVLRHVEGLGYAEVAEVLERPVGTVKAQVHRATRELRKAWEQDETREPRPARVRPGGPRSPGRSWTAPGRGHEARPAVASGAAR